MGQCFLKESSFVHSSTKSCWQLTLKIPDSQFLVVTKFRVWSRCSKILTHKKDLLHDRKRHTARDVASTCSAVRSGGGGFTLSQLGGGYPSPVLAGGTPVLGYPWPGLGHPPERTWDQRPGKEPGTGVPPPPPWTDWQTEIITPLILRMRAITREISQKKGISHGLTRKWMFLKRQVFQYKCPSADKHALFWKLSGSESLWWLYNWEREWLLKQTRLFNLAHWVTSENRGSSKSNGFSDCSQPSSFWTIRDWWRN